MTRTRGNKSLPIRDADAADAPTRPSRYGRIRAATLAGVYVLMGLHIAHWKIAGKTLAPLELNEVMYTLELGIVTAGFLFMLIACVGTLLFGRFFCGWGCHILALEDLCAWILKKLRIRPRVIRSRLLLLVPPLAMGYMFIWPQVSRVIEGRPPPAPRVQTDAQGWASFQTTDFWRNLPGPAVALATFGVCGFAIVYVLGSRSFCTYGCPYGAIFRGLDRLSPGRIIAAGDCAQCGACTAACPSSIRVHEELQQFGTVVNAACVKDLECVSACPNGAVKYGLGRPPLLRHWNAWRSLKRAFNFSFAEEALIAVVFLATLVTFRGLYDSIPFLMTLGLGAILGYFAVCAARLAYHADVRLGRTFLKRGGRMTASGGLFCAFSAFFGVGWAHCAVIRYHEYLGYRAATAALTPHQTPDAATLAAAFSHLEFCRAWGLVTPPKLTQQLGRLYSSRGEQRAMQGDTAGAIADVTEAARLYPDAAFIRYNRGVMLGLAGRAQEAIAEYRVASSLDPTDPDIDNNLGFALASTGDLAGAEASFRRALAKRDHADAHFNLARLLFETNREPEAREHLDAAARLDPRYEEIRRQMVSP